MVMRQLLPDFQTSLRNREQGIGNKDMKKLFIALLLVFGAFIGLVVLMGVLMVLAPEWANSTGGLLFIQGFQTIVLFGVTALVGVWMTEDRMNPFKQMLLNKGVSWKQGLIAFFFAVAALPMISLLAEWNKGMELPSFLALLEEMMRQMEESAGNNAITNRLTNIIPTDVVFKNCSVISPADSSI